MESVEADGSSIDEAIQSALKMMGTTRDRVEVEILSNAVRGLFGLRGRKARVRATLRAPIDTEHPPPDDEVVREEVPPIALAPSVVREGDRRAAKRAQHVLEEVVRHLGVKAEVILRQADDHFRLELTGDSSGVLIGRRGQMLDALEYVLNRAVARDEMVSTRIVVDSENYRERRREALEELARRMGEQAKKKKKAVTLNPMSPHDRRIVHLILQSDPSLVTKSSGKGYFRKLVIVPAGAGRPRRSEGNED